MGTGKQLVTGNGNQMAVGQRQKQKFSTALQTETYQKLINNTLKDPERAKRFIASISSAVAVNPQLQECTPGSILAGALLGESLNLSPSPQLGQFYLVPFKNQLKDEHGDKLWAVDEKGNKLKDSNGKWIPITESSASFILGYKGMIQLALRTGQYRKLNVLEIKEGELRTFDPLNEEITCILIDDFEKREAAKTVGYYAMFEYLNGFRKAIYWSKEKMLSHADKYSPAFNRADYQKYINGEVKQTDMWKYSSFWYKDFDDMAKKTMLRQLISKWGVMSTEMQQIIVQDEKMADIEGTEIVTSDIEIMPDPVSVVTVEDVSHPEFTDVGGQINLEDL